jgi:hypothetical protein
MSVFKILALASATWLAAGATVFADVQLTIRNGQVSLVAKDATVRQILTEWARVGQSRIVNVERIPGGPITLELKDVPEQEALDVLLRSISGYVTAPRATVIANASAFDRIIVMPTSAAPRAPAGAAPTATFPQPGMPGPFGQPTRTGETRQQGEGDDQGDAPVPGALPPNRGPVFNTFPQPQVVNPQQPGMPAAMPGVVQVPQGVAPAGDPPSPATYQSGAQPTVPFGASAVPGMIVQPPAGQAQPGLPGQPQRPGGNP